MTSVLRSPSQIGVREKYLIALSDVSAGTGVAASGVPAFTLVSGHFVGFVASADDLSGHFTQYLVSTGDLFRDMGRSITVVDASGDHLALYRNVQKVSGATTEGVDPTNAAYSANIYVRVWADDGANITVARLG